MSRVIHVLTGCTAVGKTELALRWAETNDAEVVSCDSLLFYRGMNLGTAKPTAPELARVPHHLIDVCAVTDAMDITRYVTLARAVVDDILKRGRRVLVTGGSGFYLKAFFAPVADDVEVSDELRTSLRARLEHEGLAALVAELEELNPAGLGKLDVQNPRRVVRALERCRASGLTLGVLHRDFANRPSSFADCELRLVELVREKTDLDQRIGLRVAAMLAAGLVAEVRGLMELGLEKNSSAARAIGYRETIDFLAGRLTAEQLPDEIAKNTLSLVRKQRTWFKTQLPPHLKIDAATATAAGLFSKQDENAHR